jgi:adenine-specific DNA methylase
VKNSLMNGQLGTYPSPMVALSLPPRQTKGWRSIHYLGSKLRAVDAISQLIDQVAPGRGSVCDLFAGSGTVAAALANKRDVTATDIQEYSRVICSALLLPASLSRADIDRLHSRAFNSSFYQELRWAAEALLDYESHALSEAQRGRSNLIFDLLELGPLVAPALGATAHRQHPSLIKAVRCVQDRLVKLGHIRGARTVVLRQFGGVYFSFLQALELAALLDLAASSSDKRLKDTLTAATLSTASTIANTVGKQFAQPIRPYTLDGVAKTHLLPKVIRDRRMSVSNVYLQWLQRYSTLNAVERSHRVAKADYRDALQRYCNGVSLVYADPPYTRDHYSRYYHVLETMALYDDPHLAPTNPSGLGSIGRGVYRNDRHQSPFCIKSQAPDAFEHLFSGVRRLGVPLILSYSPLPESSKPRPRVMTIDGISLLARRYFRKVELIKLDGISHNKLNNSALSAEYALNAEILLICA